MLSVAQPGCSIADGAALSWFCRKRRLASLYLGAREIGASRDGFDVGGDGFVGAMRLLAI
jgi:hypothetical protein